MVQANLLAASDPRKQFHGEAFNVAQGSSHSMLECKNLIEDITGIKLDLEIRPNRIGDVSHTLADIFSTQQQLGYKPSTDFEAQVRSMCDWYNNYYAIHG